MKIDTISLRIDFPRRSTEIRKDEKKERTWKDFKVTGFLEREVGHIKVSYTTKYPLEEINDFWHNIDYNPPRIRPVVVWQETLPEFYGNGICGRIIIKANEIAKVRFGEPLSSDTLFVQNPSGDWQETS